jgi:hypothetical protein
MNNSNTNKDCNTTELVTIYAPQSEEFFKLYQEDQTLDECMLLISDIMDEGNNDVALIKQQIKTLHDKLPTAELKEKLESVLMENNLLDLLD